MRAIVVQKRASSVSQKSRLGSTNATRAQDCAMLPLHHRLLDPPPPGSTMAATSSASLAARLINLNRSGPKWIPP